MPDSSGRGRRRRASAVAAVLALTGVGLISYGIAQQVGDPPSPNPQLANAGHGNHGAAQGSSGTSQGADPTPGPTASSSGGGPAPAPGAAGGRTGQAYVQPSGKLMARATPTTMRLPAQDIAGKVIQLGLQPNGEMAVPQNGTDTGWFSKSPTPGELGPSIVVGHVTWQGKRGVFFDLGATKPGQRVEVDRADGTTAVFQVDAVEQYPKAKFPTQKVYGATDRAELRLITCGGVYDGDAQTHLDNIVVFARLVGTRG